jgi:light-regulated signal transduction histidine kinase (bacteriophytochrome)
MGRQQIRSVTASFAAKISSLAEAETELRKANETLEARVVERTAQLNATNKELEAFSYSVSHDLRAPLRSIEGFAEALQSETDATPQERTHYVTRIRAGVKKMGSVIDDLLLLSRITRSQVERADIDITLLAREIIDDLKAADPGKKVDIKIESGLVQHGDRELAILLLRNLLANAWKYTSLQAQPKIEVGQMNEAGARAMFVRDNGVGFNMRYYDRIFMPFERLHSDEEFDGTGVGLAIAKRVADRHGGRIWAESTVGVGTTFYFSLEAP